MCEVAGSHGGQSPFPAGPQGHHIACKGEGAALCHGHWGFTFHSPWWGGVGRSWPLGDKSWDADGPLQGIALDPTADAGLGSGWGPLLLPLSLLYKANFFGTVLTKASRACNRCLPLLFTSFGLCFLLVFVFVFLNKLVLTSISGCPDACLVFDSKLDVRTGQCCRRA